MKVDNTSAIAGLGRTTPSPGKATVGRKVPVILALLTILGPASMDLFCRSCPPSPEI